MARSRPDSRQQGRIEQRGQSVRVVVYAGLDPVTGRRSYLRETIDGTDDKSWRKAENKLTEFRARIIKQRSTASSVTLSYAIDEWLRTADIEQSTRDGYVGYIDRIIKPVLGDTSTTKTPQTSPTPFAPATTYVPFDRTVTNNPRSNNNRTACRAVPNDTPYASARSRSPGSRIPDTNRPDPINPAT